MSWESLNRQIVACQNCPRLRDHCEKMAQEKRRSYSDWTYWGRPVPNFGDPEGRLLIVGLAPAAHGANRTGRMFTGDRSGDWLYRALHRAGLANQPTSTAKDDGLKLHDTAITAACHCAPPDNKPSGDEIEACQPWFDRTVDLLPVRVFLALGHIGWQTVVSLARRRKWLSAAAPKFAHGAKYELCEGQWLVGSYHPSQQNTFTGRLTEEMMDDVMTTVKKLLL